MTLKQLFLSLLTLPGFGVTLNKVTVMFTCTNMIKQLRMQQKRRSYFKTDGGSELLQVALAFIYTKSNDGNNADRVIKRFLKYAATNKVEDPWDLSYIYYLKGDPQKAIEWEEKAVDERSPDAYLMNITIMYDKKYFESEAHQQVLKKMGFVK